MLIELFATTIAIAVAVWLQGAKEGESVRRLVDERRQRRVAGTPTKRIGQLADGEVAAVRGVVRGRGAFVEGPITGRQGVFVKHWIHGGLVLVQSKLLGAHVQVRSFDLVADGMAITVEGDCFVDFWSPLEHSERTTARQVTPAQRALLDASRVPTPELGEALFSDYQFEEAVVADGDEVWVLGRVSVTVDPRGERDSPRGQPMRRAFRGTEAEPVVLMRVNDTAARG